MSREYLIRLPWPNSKLSANARIHWRPKADLTAASRKAAWAIALEQGVNMPMPDAELRFSYHPPTRARRDAQNMPHMLKAAIDGISDAMGCDDHGFRCVFPPEFSDVVKGGCVLCHIIPRAVIIPLKCYIS